VTVKVGGWTADMHVQCTCSDISEEEEEEDEDEVSATSCPPASTTITTA